MQKGLERKTRKEKKDRCFIIVVAIRERVSVVYPHLLAAEPPTIHVLIVVIIVIVIAIVVLIILMAIVIVAVFIVIAIIVVVLIIVIDHRQTARLRSSRGARRAWNG